MENLSTKTLARLAVVFSLMFAISTFLLISKNMARPLTDAEIEECTLIASDIYYNQKDVLIYEVPENYQVEIDPTSITVSPTDWRYGDVKCTVRNGEIVGKLDHSSFTEYYAACGMLTILAYIVLILFVLGVFYVVHKIEKIVQRHKNKKGIIAEF